MQLTTISGAPDGAPQKTGPRNGEFAGGSENGAPETAKTGHEAGRKKKIPRPAPECGAGRGFFARPRKIRGPACPEANTRNDVQTTAGYEGIALTPHTLSGKLCRLWGRRRGRRLISSPG